MQYVHMPACTDPKSIPHGCDDLRSGERALELSLGAVDAPLALPPPDLGGVEYREEGLTRLLPFHIRT